MTTKKLSNIKIHRRINHKILLLLIAFWFLQPNFLISQNIDKPYLAPAKDYTPLISKYIFTNISDNVSSKQESTDSKPKKIQSVLNDSISNDIEISYNDYDLGKPVKLTVSVKEKDKKISITIYNLIGNKVSDVFNASPGANEIEIDSFRKEVDKLSNGVYICVLQGYNYRIMKKFTISQ